VADGPHDREVTGGGHGWAWPSVFLAVALVSRLPLLGWGYGSDDDAWRNAVAGVHMRAVGHYVPSRVPGFPVFETIVAALVPWGPVATNGAAILTGLVAVALFLRLTGQLRLQSPRWLAFGFAFGGAMWVATGQTMDYAFGIAFLLGAYLALLTRRHLLAGVLLAFAAGCRISNGALVVSAALLLMSRRERLRAWVEFGAAFGIVAALLFVPVALSPSIGDLRPHAAYHIGHAHVNAANSVKVLRAALVFCLGKLGTITLVLGLASAILMALFRRRRSLRAGSEQRGAVAFELSAVGLIVAMFMLVPYESAYLLPGLPFAMFLFGRILSPRWIAAWATVLALESLAMPLLDKREVVPGWLFMEIQQRKTDLAESRALLNERPASRTVYVVGRFGIHRLVLLEPRLRRLAPAWEPFRGPGVALLTPYRRTGYAASLTPQEKDSLRSVGVSITEWRR
jgi:hypothetical protein